MPGVAVNIVTWNSARFIGRCLEAVLRQTLVDCSVTVVDNASTDESVRFVETWAARGVELVRNPTNAGYARAHNQALAVTDSEFVLTLNPDVILAPTFLERMVAAITSSPAVGSASGKLLRISPEQFRAGDGLFDLPVDSFLIDSAGLAMRRNRRQQLRGYLRQAGEACLGQAPIFGPDGAAALYRRAMLEDVAVQGEVFDTSFVSHKEDVDLAWRAQLLGWESVYTPLAIGYHVRGFRPGERRQMPAPVRRDAVKNRWLMLVKNELPSLLLRHLPHVLAYDFASFVYMVLFEQRSLLALLDFVGLLPTMLRRRRALLSRRKRTAATMRRWFTQQADSRYR